MKILYTVQKIEVERSKELKDIKDFRPFYNQTIHPELLRLERKRKRLLFLFLVSFLMFLAAMFIQLYLNEWLISLALLIPIGLYISFLLYRIQRFRSTFKPHVVNLILDFIDDGLSFGTLSYSSRGFIPKERFIASRLFATPAQFYQGEDYISGSFGELDFEMCELNVRELSKVRNRLNYVFRGIFLHTTINRELTGMVIVLPREFKQYLSRSIRAFNVVGGDLVENGLEENFNESFMTFATKDTSVTKLLTKEIQQAILDYRNATKKEIYVSFIENEIYIGITEPKDILEPFLFSSNVSFELVKEFFEDIHLMLELIVEIDKKN